MLGVAVLGLSACREINPAFMGGGQLSAGSGTDPTVGDTTESTSEPTDTTSASTTTSPTTTTPTTTDPATTDPSATTDEPSSSSSGVPVSCGNGMVDEGEDCDDMNADNTDACLDTCMAASCGDGFVQAGVEDCDGTVGDETCEALGEPGGGLACATDCTIDASGCACGNSQAPLGGMCPVECTGGCDGTTCTIDCAGNSACEGDPVACPAGWDCVIDCDGSNACRGAMLACTGNACTVECNSNFACRDAQVQCGEGTCAVTCLNGNSVCDGLEIVCGANDSTITCNGNDVVVVTPYAGSSCLCEQTGC